MSEARDRKMKRKRRLEELKATKVMRACKIWRRQTNLFPYVVGVVLLIVLAFADSHFLRFW